jgi:transposase
VRLEELERAHPEAEIQLWAEDEARLGLKPVIRRVWAPVGKRPVARFKRGYKWTYLYAFVHPESGEVYWLILPTVNTELFSMTLNEFAREVGAGKDKRVLLLVVDQAGWHTGKEVEVPEGIHLEFLPSGSPELQPAERLWPLTNEAVANRLSLRRSRSSKRPWWSVACNCSTKPRPSGISPTTAGGPWQHDVPRTVHPDSVSVPIDGR